MKKHKEFIVHNHSKNARWGSAAGRFLELWVRIPQGAWTSVSCECCLLSGRGFSDRPIIVQRSPTECGVFSVFSKPQQLGDLGSLGAVEP